MKNMKCSTQPCSSTPKLVCDCQSNPIYLCLGHLEDHLEASFGKKHNLNPISVVLSDEELKKLVEARRMVIESRRNVVSEINQRFTSKIAKLTEKHSSLLRSTMENISSLLFNIENAIANKLALSSYSNPFIKQISTVPIIEDERHTQNLKHIVNSNMNLPFQYLGQQRYNYCFDHNSKTLIQIDNLNYKRCSIGISNLDRNIGDCAGICVLDDETVFYCGGIPTRFLFGIINNAYIINPKTKNAERISNLPCPVFLVVPFLLDGYIYLFGGKHNWGKNRKTSLRYSFTQKYWEYRKDIPMESHNVSCVSTGKSILLFGYNTSGVYEFDYIDYRKVLNTPVEHGLICKNSSGKIFVLINGDIYISDTENYKGNWEIKKQAYNRNLINESLETAPQLFGNSFYFKIYPNRYVRFNYEDLTVGLPSLTNN